MSHKYLKSLLLSLIVTVTLVLYATIGQSSLPANSQSPVLLVGAAVSMQKALLEITPLYEQSGANLKVNYSFGSSGALQQQIEQGAPIDVFISAASKQMNILQQKSLLVPKTRINLLANQLVLVTPKTSTLKLTDFRQLTKPEIQRISIGEPRSVPAGEYAMSVFSNLGILEQIKSKLVLGNNVKSVLTSVETGDADAGVVYISDALNTDRVVISAIADRRLHALIVYPIAVLKSSKILESAKKYIKFLQTKPVQVIFKKYGFGIVKP